MVILYQIDEVSMYTYAVYTCACMHACITVMELIAKFIAVALI